MSKSRLEAFSDGVIAILITILVLEFEVPHGSTLGALRPLAPIFLAYVLSFLYVAIYWNNHHHMLHSAERVSGAILWANLHLLFWLSLIPFATAWLGSHPRAAAPTAAYGAVLLGAALAYRLLQEAIARHHGGASSALGRAVGRDRKGTLSIAGYAAAIGLAFVAPVVAQAVFVAIAVWWVIPDRRIENVLSGAAR